MVLLCLWLLQPEAMYRSTASVLLVQQDVLKKDTAKTDSIPPYTPSKVPTYEQVYRFGDPFSNRVSPSPLLLPDPSSIDLEVEIQDSTVSYSVYERIGDSNFRPVTNMSFEEYDAYDDQQSTKQYFQERSAGLDGESAVSGRSLIPRLYISPVFDRLFGGSYVDIQPNGFVNLDFGGTFQRVDNPSIPRRQQRNGGFNFDQQISLNLVGKIGEKLAVTANFDNNNTFDFQNNLKVEYTGYEEDIVKKIEIGNVSMPASNSLITGAQSLFGVKTQLQFGKLYITGVASRQQGQTEVISVESGHQGKEFEVRASAYDENRHFFLGHFFRNNYEKWLSNLPQVTSGLNVTRVEVYVINRNNDTETTREVLGLMDLGEGSTIFQSGNPRVGTGSGGPTANVANDLYSSVARVGRGSDQIVSTLEEDFGFTNGTDFVKIGTARQLDSDEYDIHNKLGYISLLRQLSNDEMLAVAYEYTFDGQTYRVGELTEDYSGLSENQVVFLKMLRPNKINTDVPTWDLMMKNIYSLNASQIEQKGFQMRIHYRDDASGIDNPSLHVGTNTKDKPLLQLLGMDQLNQNNDSQKDGNFDFVEGITINSEDGYLIFPVLEPFGSKLESYFTTDEQTLKSKYVYNELYEQTRADAAQEASKNKYYILGEMTSGTSSVISLSGINIAENSVLVTAGSTPLTEGLDYRVNYNLGTVTILNEGILNSGKKINISYEKSDVFNFQSRWLYGARADYQFNDKFNIGATLLRLSEKMGGVTRYTVGGEPTSNTKYGFDINFQDEVPFLTKAMDFLPLVNTKAPSSITFSGEFAQILPEASSIVDGEATAYIDDFENAATTININGWAGWSLASTPETTGDRFSAFSDDLSANYRRAKIAWYTVDQSVFYLSSGTTRPQNISEEDLANHYVRPVLPQEIFRERSTSVVLTPESLFDVAYYPSERGQYNYSPDVDSDGKLTDPERNYGGITRAITNNVDFDNTNIEYLEFWLLDPFIDGDRGKIMDGEFNDNNITGGDLVFNLGSVSEDVIPDGRHEFESGFPIDGDVTETIPTQWGRAPTNTFLTNTFQNTAGARENQDVGFDGLKDSDEQDQFSSLINQLGVSGEALAEIQNDPSSDNFQYFIGPELDSRDAKILERYKKYNGLDGNTPYSSNGTTRASTNKPDNEDLNSDNTLSELEEYYEYRVELQKDRLSTNKYVVDEITSRDGEATWYLFRIPIRDPDRVYGGINGYKSMKYIRMYMTNFSQPVVLRMSELQFVGSQWRKYNQALNDPGLGEIPETTYSDFDISVVNIEDNSTGSEENAPYVLPPGISRDRDNTKVNEIQFNEQSLQICVDDLEDKDARAVFKTVTYDLISYGRMKMFFHAEANNGDILADDEVTAFLRLGTDYTENYYEIEVPLKITPENSSASDANIREIVWPVGNELDFSITELLGVKSERNRSGFSELLPYTVPSNDGKYQFTVQGNPDLSSVQSLMIGIRNPESDDRSTKSVCLWANELRVTDFNSTKGWAANARMSVKLADVATVSGTTSYRSIGFGSIQESASQRAREEIFQYDVSANVNIDKFLFPEKTGLKIPMYVSYEKSIRTPQFDPLDPDIPLEASLASIESDEERNRYKKLVQDRSERRSINFTNVHKEKVNPDAKSHFYDIENLSFSYAYSDVVTSNINTESYLNRTVSGGFSYNFSPRALVLEPFAKSKAFKSPFLKLIKDINLSLLPSNVSISADLNRNLEYTQLFNDQLTTEGVDPYYERLFTFTRNYSVRWNLFKNLNIDYNARAYAIIDEPEDVVEGEIDTYEERKYIWEEIKKLGRMKNFQQNISGTYKTPLDKLPLTDWMSADLKYAVGYTWTAGSKVDETDVNDVFFGHTLKNNRQQGLAGKLDMVKLYNKVAFLKSINKPKRPKKGEEVKSGGVGVGFLKLLMSLRTVNLTYNVTESTTLTGFNKSPFLFGMDSSGQAPGWGFLLGSQDPNIRYRAAENGWLVESGELTTPFEQTYSTNLSIRASLEPTKDLKIRLDAQRSNNASFQEIFRFNEDEGVFNSLTPSRTGSYSISFMSIRTAFDKRGSDNSTKTFNTFVENIGAVQQRQNSLNPGSGEYNQQSQDVLIPAFISAYSGQSVSQSKLSPFPKIPIPGWRLDYNGLTRIPALSDVFSSITISHGYKSTYTVNDYNFNISNYGNRINDDFSVTLKNNILDYPQASVVNDSGQFVPIYIINQVTISDQFAPLMGVSLRTKSNISTRLEYNRTRSLSLSMSNAQVAETRSNDVTLNVGYTKEKFKLPFKVKGRTVTLENTITMNLSLTVRDTETIQHKVDGVSTLTNGNTNLQYRPSITYKLNKSLDLTMYFQRTVTEPKVSSFKTATTAFGTQLRFSLAQ